MKKYLEFRKLNEDGEGGVAMCNAGTGGGMGAITAPIPSSIPGDVSGSISGSGDLPAYDHGTHFGTSLNPNSSPFKQWKKDKKKKKIIYTKMKDFLDLTKNA